jgi:hypothetical protein
MEEGGRREERRESEAAASRFASPSLPMAGRQERYGYGALMPQESFPESFPV